MWNNSRKQRQWNYEGEKHCQRHRLISIDFRFNRKFCDIIYNFFGKKLMHTRRQNFAVFFRLSRMHRLNFAQKSKQKGFAETVQIFGSDIKPTTGKMKVLSLSNSNQSMSWPFLLQQKVTQSRNSMKWKGLSTVIFLLSKSRSDCPFCNDLFWKSQFNENEKNFHF